MARNGWPQVELSRLCDSIDYGYTASAVDEPGGPRFLRITDIVPGFIDWCSVPHCRISPEDIEKYRLHHGDVVIARTGATTGYSAYVSHPPESVFASYLVRLRIRKEADSRFVAYFLRSPIFWQYMHGVLGDKSAQPNASAKTMTRVRIPTPTLSEQKAIAHILGTLDDKIELNRRMNETLEATARAIFKSWFVDFDPVRAKMDGRQPPGMDAETAALFPDRVDGSLLGKIPCGWKCGRLDDLLLLQRGFDLPTKQRRPGRYPVFSAGGHHGAHDDFRVSGPGVVTGRSGVLGNVFYVHEDFWPLNTTLWVKEFRASRPIHSYHLLNTMSFETFNAGSAVPTLNRNHVHGLPVVVPALAITERFEDVVRPMFERCRRNHLNSNALVATRDALLRKLLSGEVRVTDTQTFAEGLT